MLHSDCHINLNFIKNDCHLRDNLCRNIKRYLINIKYILTDDETYFNNPEVFSDCDIDTREIVYQLWEDFAQVATKLLDRIEETETSLPVVEVDK